MAGGESRVVIGKANQTNEWLALADEILAGHCLVVVDGGARNKTWELPRLAPFCRVIGFEPNHAEYEKILANATDLEMAGKLHDLPYRSIRYVDKALADRVGRATLNITRGAGASSLLEPNIELLVTMEYLFPYAKRFPDQFQVVTREEVETATLDTVAENEKLECVDYLKLDTQGTEYECLLGAETLLKERRVGVIKTEVEFLPLYKGQHLFGDIDAHLRSHGFMLLDLVFDSRHKVIWSGHRMRADRGTLLFGDAYYTLTVPVQAELTPFRRMRHSLVLGELGFLDVAIALIRSINLETRVDEVCRRLTYYLQQDRRTWKRKVKDRGKTVLSLMARILGE
ncbi:MAG: FkbM family methyltransferase [Methyloceanibacter sp.]